MYQLTDIDETGVTSTQAKIHFQPFLRTKESIFGFPCCNTRRDISLDVSITTVGLILMKLV